jgi:hypothetical protein
MGCDGISVCPIPLPCASCCDLNLEWMSRVTETIEGPRLSAGFIAVVSPSPSPDLSGLSACIAKGDCHPIVSAAYYVYRIRFAFLYSVHMSTMLDPDHTRVQPVISDADGGSVPANPNPNPRQVHQGTVDHGPQREDEFTSDEDDSISVVANRKMFAPCNQRETDSGELAAKRPRLPDAAEYILLCALGMQVLDMKLFMGLKQSPMDFIVDPCARIREGARRAVEGSEAVYRGHILAEAESHRACYRAVDKRFRGVALARGSLERREEWARRTLQHEERVAGAAKAEGQRVAKNLIETRQVLRWNIIERAVQSRLPGLDFLGCIQRRKKSPGFQAVVVQAIARIFPDTECPLTSILMFKLNALASYLMRTKKGRIYSFQFTGNHFLCKEGRCRLICATTLPYQILSDLVRDADVNPTSSTWPINKEGLMKIKAPSHRTLWDKLAGNQGGSKKVDCK